MNAAILLVPLFLVRYGLLAALNKNALRQAAFFPPMQGVERAMYGLYQLSTAGLIVILFFLKITFAATWLWVGAAIYMMGIVLLFWSTFDFARPDTDGFNQSGLYRISRNPMYVAYFTYFLGCAILTHSFLFVVVLCVFQLSTHWIILAEERYCFTRFGERYKQYSQKVRRYL